MSTLVSANSTLTIYPVMLCHWNCLPVAFSAYYTLSNLKSFCVAVSFSVYSDYFSRCVTFWVFVVFPFACVAFCAKVIVCCRKITIKTTICTRVQRPIMFTCTVLFIVTNSRNIVNFIVIFKLTI